MKGKVIAGAYHRNGSDGIYRCGRNSPLLSASRNRRAGDAHQRSVAPFEYLGSDNEVAGVDVELQRPSQRNGVPLKIVDMDFDGIITSIQSGKGDIGASGTPPTTSAGSR